MLLRNDFHLTYCTNIHPGEHWPEVFQSLEQHTKAVKDRLAPGRPFGLGLRLSDIASQELLQGKQLKALKAWLDQHGIYVFTMNGFPFGGFHRQVVKDAVHQPDWTTPQRKAYTLRLFDILAELLPQGIEGGISTSPISYKHWHKDAASRQKAFEVGTQNLAAVALHLYEKEQKTGKWMHLDIEPEPDGLIENTREVLDFYQDYLIPQGVAAFRRATGLSETESAACIRRYIQICYDVCHFAIEYEQPAEVFQAFEKADISIGKIQISAALKADLPEDCSQRGPVRAAFEGFNESTYLHQVIARTHEGGLLQFNDLPEALKHIEDPRMAEWRTHFHVPLFIDRYQWLYPTQDAILDVLALLREKVWSRHLEVETYTWEVLPEDLRADLTSSISRELEWVVEHFS